MKILQINNYNYLRGGSEKVYQVTIDLLLQGGHDVRFFSIADKKNTNLCDGIAVDVASWQSVNGVVGKFNGIKNFIYNRKIAEELDSYITEFCPDVAHLHIFYGRLSNAIVAVLRKHNIPIVQSVHEFRLLCPAYTCLDSSLNICEECAGTKFKLSCIRKRCIKSSLAISFIAALECSIRDTFFSYQKNFAAFIMVSNFIRQKHIQYYPEIATKCYQIYNSVDTNSYSKYIVTESEKGDYYLYLGRLSREKGIDKLINAFIDNPRLKLKIAGDGPDADKLRSKVIESGVENIIFLGFIGGEELLKTIAKARYTMVPSEWYENNPLTIIESLALGTPIIGSDIGGIPELIEDGVNGYLHESKSLDSLKEVLLKSTNISAIQYRDQCSYSVDLARRKFDNGNYYNMLISVYNQIVKK